MLCILVSREYFLYRNGALYQNTESFEIEISHMFAIYQKIESDTIFDNNSTPVNTLYNVIVFVNLITASVNDRTIKSQAGTIWTDSWRNKRECEIAAVRLTSIVCCMVTLNGKDPAPT